MDNKFTKPASLTDKATHYCSGCGHGILHHLIAKAVDELKVRETVIGIAPVGCAVVAYDYWDFDVSEAAHGRALAVATGIKRCLPQNLVFTYQGDGDLASIGLAETIHAANRGENITCIFVNNACYGMTGGQMAPTTVIGQKTTTTPFGRQPEDGDGWPLKVSEMLGLLTGVNFVVRTAINSPAQVKKTFEYIREAFRRQQQQKGFTLVEVLSTCPTIWKKSPEESLKWVQEEMVKVFPLGVIKE
jgi:2-oxoglutarate/2-oxoacid ferredoxin oxidoreductase subunit beta